MFGDARCIATAPSILVMARGQAPQARPAAVPSTCKIALSPSLAYGGQSALYCSISFKSTVTRHAPLSIAWQGSRVTWLFVEPPEHHTGLKIACKTQKSQKFRFGVENFAGVTPKFGCCRNVELVFWVTHHTQCRFERNTTVLFIGFFLIPGHFFGPF
jgi:hypothetical protein